MQGFPAQVRHCLATIATLVSVAAVTPAQSSTAISGLWLVHLSATEARLVLWDDGSDAPTVSFGVRGAAARTSVRAGSGPLRSVILKDLEPGKVYEARCGWRRATFETPIKSETHLRIGLLGHTGGTHGSHRHQPQEVVDRLRALQPDFVIHAGDAVYECGPRSFHQDFLRMHDPLMGRVPVYLAPGNHEAGWPRLKATYAEFRRALPYPFAKKVTDDDVFWIVERGPVRFVFLSYYRDRLLPGKPQRRWLDAVLAKPTGPFTVLVGGFSRGTFPKRDGFLKSLPRDKVDLIIGGDADGASIQRTGIPFVYVGSGGSGPHPYALLEAEPHRLVVNVYDIKGAHRGSVAVRDRHTYPVKSDLLPAIRRADYKMRTSVTPHADGSVTFTPTEAPKPVTVLSAVELSSGLKGLQLEVRAEGKRPSRMHQNLYVLWAPDGDNPPVHRSQPIHLPFDGSSQRITIPLPARDPTTGRPIAPARIGIRMIDPSPNLKQLTITRAYAF